MNNNKAEQIDVQAITRKAHTEMEHVVLLIEEIEAFLNEGDYGLVEHDITEAIHRLDRIRNCARALNGAPGVRKFAHRP